MTTIREMLDAQLLDIVARHRHSLAHAKTTFGAGEIGVSVYIEAEVRNGGHRFVLALGIDPEEGKEDEGSDGVAA